MEQARFAYDPLGRRVEKVAGSVTTSYTYDHENVVRETRGVTPLRYLHGPFSDEPVAMDDGQALAYIHADGLGSVVKATDSAGAVALERQYDAWGNPQAGASEPGYAFTGREWDPETGLYYYRTRYYNASLGRFVSEDTIGLNGGINLYAYVTSAPVNLTDPNGTAGRGRERECGPCTFKFDNDPTKGPHVHWWCPGQAEGCAKPNGEPCDGSGPIPPRIRECVQKVRPKWLPLPSCDMNCKILVFLVTGYYCLKDLVKDPPPLPPPPPVLPPIPVFP